MTFPDMRFVQISGATVTVRVNSADEARHALKELKLLKREAQRHRKDLSNAARALDQQAKAASRARVSGGAAARGKTRRADGAKPVIDNPLSYVWHSLAAVAEAASGGRTAQDLGSERGKPSGTRPRTAHSIKRDLETADRIVSGIDACRLQIEARLLDEAAPKRPAPKKAAPQNPQAGSQRRSVARTRGADK